MSNSGHHISSFPSHPLGRLGPRASVEIQRPPLSALELMLKRTLDLMLAVLLLVILAPLLIAVSLLIKLDSRGPLIARFGCLGFDGRFFSIYKFNTMTVPKNGNMISQVGRNAPRMSRPGYLLRSTGIDELPQLVNVLQGHMSLVGPRPHPVTHDDQFAKFIATTASRQRLKPGLWPQINEGTTQLGRMEDLLYIKNWSFFLDLKIIALTLFGLTPREDEH